jgi:hypothetical protein
MHQAPAHRLLGLALLVLCGPVCAASVQKWTDANGQVHYGDSPPPGASTQSMRLNVAPPSSRPQPAYFPPPTPEVTGKPSAPQSGSAEAERRQREQQAATAAAQARAKALSDKAVIDSCRAQRNNYCDQGANAIRQRDYEKAQMQAADQQLGAIVSGRPIPPGQRIRPVDPCPWPQTCTDKKK